MPFDANRFKPGDLVVGFERKPSASPWKPGVVTEMMGEVVSVEGNWVYIDTMFGPIPFDASDVEFEDAPF